MQGSPFAQLFADERLHKNLPGRRGVARVIWRWACNSLSGGIESLIREYDADLVPNEGLLRYDATSKRLMPVQERLSLNSKSDRAPRALLVIHGLLSNTEAVIDDLKGRWLDGMSSRYAAILGLDHRTLSKDPEQNAVELFEMLKRYAPELVRDQRLDVVTHSRGGLFARAFCELEGHAAAVRNLVMVGTPNCGTDLANSKNWGRLADSLVNLSGIAQAKPIGYLAGFLARLAVMGVQTAAPGLMAMNPETAGVKNKFLSRLQQADRKNLTVRYSAVTADFEPTPIIPNLKSLVATAKSMGIDTATDSFFGKDGEPVANDLVVNTAHVWCVGQSAAEKQNLPKSFGKRVLAFVPPDSPAELPSGVRREVELGVNHFNLLANPTTQDAIRKWLSEL